MIYGEKAVGVTFTGNPSMQMELVKGRALLTVTYGSSYQKVTLQKGDASMLLEVVSGFVNWKPTRA